MHFPPCRRGTKFYILHISSGSALSPPGPVKDDPVPLGKAGTALKETSMGIPRVIISGFDPHLGGLHAGLGDALRMRQLVDLEVDA